MFCIFVGGCSESFEDKPGIVWVQYTASISQQTNIKDDIPVDAVNQFLLEEGYTPKVLKTYFNEHKEIIEVVYLGWSIDPSDLLGMLTAIPGVVLVELEMNAADLFEIPSDGQLIEIESD